MTVVRLSESLVVAAEIGTCLPQNSPEQNRPWDGPPGAEIEKHSASSDRLLVLQLPLYENFKPRPTYAPVNSSSTSMGNV